MTSLPPAGCRVQGLSGDGRVEASLLSVSPVCFWLSWKPAGNVGRLEGESLPPASAVLCLVDSGKSRGLPSSL